MDAADEPQAEVAARPRLTGWGKGCLAVLGMFLLGYLAILLVFGWLDAPDTVELRIPNRDDEYLEVKRMETGFKTTRYVLTINHVRSTGWFTAPQVRRMAYYEVLAPEKLPPLAALTFWWRTPDELLIQANGRDYLRVTPATDEVRPLARLAQ